MSFNTETAAAIDFQEVYLAVDLMAVEEVIIDQDGKDVTMQYGISL